tara:strand:- start:59 stop:622 length:564 start_codon:yes stop_codon:yes gene_type:complete
MRSRNYKKHKTGSKLKVNRKSNRKNIQKGGMQKIKDAVASVGAPKEIQWTGSSGMGILVRQENEEGDRGIKPYVFRPPVSWGETGHFTIPSRMFINLVPPVHASLGNHRFRSASGLDDRPLQRAMDNIMYHQPGLGEEVIEEKGQAMRNCTNAHDLRLLKMWEGELYKLHGHKSDTAERYILYQIMQ